MNLVSGDGDSFWLFGGPLALKFEVSQKTDGGSFAAGNDVDNNSASMAETSTGALTFHDEGSVENAVRPAT